ncbi:DUF4235 domain-containing protein [Ornithinimicrobium sp. INDO-MA30-4]|uniref:DUF4235 domain-containing protein n=1 Tax=Ornithinimicrobium sp. INDO-MA30-4 TaxID=2908651 RepID=UPI001F1742ED|nr:DUF4235 domain-containing protein [Ornithinimicrobium sp. INDO-MA30-4]UJH69588.1 DUF4235 domain-containing protein [Ornithinimicrobium sp. INDO-MA30-4]
MSDKLWSLATTGAAIGAGVLAKKVTEGTWKFVTGSNSPSNPEDPEVNWGEAVMFALVSGAVVQLIKVTVNHKSTQAYAKRKGHLPESVAA